MAGRRSGRAQNVETVPRRDRDQPGHVWRTLERRRQHALGCWFADLVQEALELERREADQRPCALGLAVEGVRDPLGAECERTCGQRQALLTDPYGELAL